MPRGPFGKGHAASNSRSLTRGPTYPHQAGGGTDGETAGVGSTYSASINERSNKSNPRNQGPERGDSPVLASSIPIATMGGRTTGKI